MSAPSHALVGPRVVDLHGAARVVLGDRAAAELTEDDAAGIALRLERGSLLASVKHRERTSPFRVRAARVDVRVVGTVLWVDLDDGGAVTVLVGRGAVEVSAAGDTPVLVRAGERWPAGSTASPSENDLRSLGERDPAPRFAPPAVRAPAVATTPPASAPAAIRATPASLTARPAECAEPDPRAAIACLSKLAASSHPLRAESALFEIGTRQLRDLADPRAALATWRQQRARFPSGALRAEADVSIISALVTLREESSARAEIDTYLAAHAGSVLAPQVHFLLGSLDRSAGDCAHALPELDAALAAPDEPWSAEARAQRAACRADAAKP